MNKLLTPTITIMDKFVIDSMEAWRWFRGGKGTWDPNLEVDSTSNPRLDSSRMLGWIQFPILSYFSKLDISWCKKNSELSAIQRTSHLYKNPTLIYLYL